MLLGIAAALALLTRGYGAFLLTLPWNPYLPVLWWFVFLLAVWSVFDDDLAMLPVAVFAGSFCMQTHISYLGLDRRPRRGGSGGRGVVGDPAPRRSRSAPALWRWGGISVVLGAVLWTPPVIDQFAHSPGNLGIIRDYFSNPPDATIGVHRGVGVLLAELDPVEAAHEDARARRRRARGQRFSRLPVVVLLVVFAVSILAAWRLRRRAILLLDAVLVVALGLGLVSSVRIFGNGLVLSPALGVGPRRPHALRHRLDR